MEILKEERYRSLPKVNMTEDMVRATLICSVIEWKKIKNMLNEMFKEN